MLNKRCALLAPLQALLAASVVSAGCAAPAQLRAPLPEVVSRSGAPCRFGADYGSGMVALGFPPAIHTGLVALHDEIVARHPEMVAAFMADQPYAPHTSLIYGVMPEDQARVAAALADLSRTLRAAPITLGDIHYWDDAAGKKTTLVVSVEDPAGVALEAHNRLQALLRGTQRFSFQPHITLAYLQPGGRLPAVTADDLKRRLRQFSATPQVLWLTDSCGLARGYEALQAPAPTAAADGVKTH